MELVTYEATIRFSAERDDMDIGDVAELVLKGADDYSESYANDIDNIRCSEVKKLQEA